MLRNWERSLMPTTLPPGLEFAVHHRQYKIALFAVLCVIAVFLCHVPDGPWSAVHGPASALEAARYALTFFLLMTLAASIVIRRLFHGFLPASACLYTTAEMHESLIVESLGAVPIRC
jgi:hypothetical protein